MKKQAFSYTRWNCTFNPTLGNKHGDVQKLIYRDVHIKHYLHKLRRAAIERGPKYQIQIIFYIIMPIKTDV